MKDRHDAKSIAEEAFSDAMDGRLSEEDAVEAVMEVAEALEYDDGEIDRLFRELGIRSEIAREKEAHMITAGVSDWAISQFKKDSAMMKAVMALLLSANILSAYTVKDGDSVWKIADGKTKVVRQIQELNGLDDNSIIRPGQELVLPGEVKKSPSETKKDSSAQPAEPSSEAENTHVVQKGESMSSIAKRYGVSVKELKDANPGIADFDKISVGQVIALPKTAIDPKADYVAKVIYSETSTKCNSEEVGLVARVIYNRIGDRRFGGGSDAYAVVSAKNAFSCTSGKDGNVNWSKYSKELNDATRNAYKIAEELMARDASSLPGDSEIVYYCNKSLAVANAKEDSDKIGNERYGYPKGWESSAWKPVPVKATDHFVFYKIVKRTK